MITTLDDLDPMPFGKYRGELMADVPASYLHYLWTNGIDEKTPVGAYIKISMKALKEEYPDGIWERK